MCRRPAACCASPSGTRWRRRSAAPTQPSRHPAGRDEIDDAVAEVDAFLHASDGIRSASWWLSERSTPDDLEEQLLARGCTRYDDDYLHAAMLLTAEPPARPTTSRRARSRTLEEFVEARRVATRGVRRPRQPRTDDDELRREWEHRCTSRCYAAWIDGRIASVGRGVPSRASA